jgi:hypothetical protein
MRYIRMMVARRQRRSKGGRHEKPARKIIPRPPFRRKPARHLPNLSPAIAYELGTLAGAPGFWACRACRNDGNYHFRERRAASVSIRRTVAG